MRKFQTFYNYRLSQNPDKVGDEVFKNKIREIYDQRIKADFETFDALKEIEKFREDSRKKRKEKIILPPEKEIETIFGKREETYYTEKELLEGYKIPKYKDLSIDEKIIFNNIK